MALYGFFFCRESKTAPFLPASVNARIQFLIQVQYVSGLLRPCLYSLLYFCLECMTSQKRKPVQTSRQLTLSNGFCSVFKSLKTCYNITTRQIQATSSKRLKELFPVFVLFPPFFFLISSIYQYELIGSNMDIIEKRRECETILKTTTLLISSQNLNKVKYHTDRLNQVSKSGKFNFN